MAIIWFILAMYFVGITAALATEVYEHKDMLANSTENIRNEAEKISDSFNLIPLLTLVSLVGLWVVYVCVFLRVALC
jgi:flagellar biosynthesis protein FliP